MSFKPHFFQQKLIRSLQLFLPVALLCLMAAFILYRSEIETIQNKIHSSESQAINMATHSVGKMVQSITTDLAYLVAQQEFIEIISSSENAESNHLNQHNLSNWVTFSQIKKLYDQIRWLDESGHERERVNYNVKSPYKVAENQLQDKSKRYYFTDTLKLNRGEYFISPMDLNIERGQIERPLKPVIRVGTPVYSQNGHKKGILLLNYFAENLLNEYSQNIQTSSSIAWLLNHDGYWLKGPTDMEWGFMFQQPQHSMHHLYPQAWATIMASKQGQFVDDNGLWTFSTIYPLLEGQKTSTTTHDDFFASRSMQQNQHYLWKSVLLMPHEQYQSAIKPITLIISMVTIAILIIFYIGHWLLASAWVKEKQTEQKLIRLNKNLENTVNDRTQQLQLAKKRAEELAQTDELTGMNNRRSFFKQGRIISEQAIRYGLQYTIMMLDIDWFKKVNDNYGHSIGDLALQEIATVIMQGIRTPDISGRIGGEEFAIILPQTTPEKTVEIAERLRQAVKSIAISVPANKKVSLTMSIGIGQYNDEVQSLHEVLNQADKALYQAKNQGRDRVVLFTEQTSMLE